MAPNAYKDSARKTASDNVLCDKAFETASNPKYDRYQTELAYIVYKFFDEKFSGGKRLKSKIATLNEQLAHELRKLIIKKLLCVIDVCGKYGWGIPLKDETITKAFRKI